MKGSPGKGAGLFHRVESLDLIRVSKWFLKTNAVRDLSFSVSGGELIALIGGSGSGKTTTLRMINRLIEPDAGQILINGVPISTLDPIYLRRSIGYVIQQIGLFPHMSVQENISIPLKLGGYTRVDIQNRIDELLELVSLSPVQYRDRRPAELSGGQQQRVGLARALAADPPLLLMDEPFGALDPLLRRQLQEEFIRIKRELRKTILFVTHDIDEALLLGDRIAVLQEGTLYFLGNPQDLLITAQQDPYLSVLTGGDRLCTMRSVPVSMLAVPAGDVIYCTDLSNSIRIRDAVRNKEVRGAVLSLPDEKLRILLLDQEGNGNGISESPVIRFAPGTTVLEALSRFSRSSARAAVLTESDAVQVILLEDLIGLLSGGGSA
ncbi:MAG: ATP-binding cassette domain-containing protein [Methanospirillaceae archaeon]|nr:ATP-binding cassette domain-containing protein [Methanospirillaceae archaeon]